jgi:transcriptional regulator with XRE-family HTH domain
MMVEMTKTDRTEVGRRVGAVMTKLGMSIDDLAKALDVHRSAVTNWLYGYNQPQVAVAYELVKMLPGVTLEWIYLGDDRLVPGSLSRDLDIIIGAKAQGLAIPKVPAPAAPRSVESRRRPKVARNMESACG